MTKKVHNIIPSKFLPLGSRRITNADGDRVWLINGKEFASKAEYSKYVRDQHLAKQLALKAAVASAEKKSDTLPEQPEAVVLSTPGLLQPDGDANEP